jgi:hypothetical protein
VGRPAQLTDNHTSTAPSGYIRSLPL